MELKRRRGESRSNEQWVIRRNKVINVARVEQEQAVDYSATPQDQSLRDPSQVPSQWEPRAISMYIITV